MTNISHDRCTPGPLYSPSAATFVSKAKLYGIANISTTNLNSMGSPCQFSLTFFIRLPIFPEVSSSLAARTLTDQN